MSRKSSGPKYARRVDSNHDTIRDRLKQIPGFEVEDTSRIGKGFPDLQIGAPYWGTNEPTFVLVELKSQYGKLTPSQEKFWEKWGIFVRIIQAKKVSQVLIRGFGWPVEDAERLD